MSTFCRCWCGKGSATCSRSKLFVKQPSQSQSDVLFWGGYLLSTLRRVILIQDVMKPHCKIIISDLVVFFVESDPKIKNSHRNAVKQTAENGQKNLVRWRSGRYYDNGAGCQEFEAVDWSWTWPGILGLLQQAAYTMTTADHDLFQSVAWFSTTARWHHWRHKHCGFTIPGGAALSFFVWSGCQFFYLCRSWKSGEFDGDFSYHPFTYFTCGEAIAEVGHLELTFISCPYLSFLRKKFMVQGEDKLKRSAQANLERNRQRFERKK